MIISIVIPIHNRLEITKIGLENLYLAINYYKTNYVDKLKISVVVVDDGSTDGSYEWINKNYKDVKLLKGDGNLWWSGSINTALDWFIEQKSYTDYILLWNNDVKPDRNYFKYLEECIVSLPTNSIIGSTIYVLTTKRIWSYGGYFGRITGLYGMYRKELKSVKNYAEVDWLTGMGTLVPFDLIKKHNLRWDDRNFPQYHGDADFTLRAKKNGIRILVNNKLIIYNNVEVTGITRIKSIRDLILFLTSNRSNYSIKKNIKFYSKHGVVPFAFIGLLIKYSIFILKTIKVRCV